MELGGLTNLHLLSLSRNQLTGVMPVEAGQPYQPVIAVPGQQPIDRCDTGGTGRSFQPLDAGANGKPVDR